VESNATEDSPLQCSTRERVKTQTWNVPYITAEGYEYEYINKILCPNCNACATCIYVEIRTMSLMPVSYQVNVSKEKAPVIE
jgi:hypothetical protein